MPRPANWILTLLAGALLAGCVPQTNKPSAMTPSQTIRLTAADNNKTLTLHQGDTLEVVLTGNPSTGFTWVANPSPEPVLQAVGEAQFEADSNSIGAPGKLTMRYRAAKPGQTVLMLGYLRTWENLPPVQTFSATVTVQ